LLEGLNNLLGDFFTNLCLGRHRSFLLCRPWYDYAGGTWIKMRSGRRHADEIAQEVKPTILVQALGDEKLQQDFYLLVHSMRITHG
jgi:hypothetical protein